MADETANAIAQLAEIRRVAVRMGVQYSYQDASGDQYQRGLFHAAGRLWETLLRAERNHPVPELGQLRDLLDTARNHTCDKCEGDPASCIDNADSHEDGFYGSSTTREA